MTLYDINYLCVCYHSLYSELLYYEDYPVVVQVVARTIIPPGDGRLREGGHIDTVGAQPPLLCASEKM